MKKLFLLLIGASIASISHAQDTIVFKNASDIEAQITAITPETITYKRWDNPNGPTYTVNKDEVFYIKYENNTKEVFNEEDYAHMNRSSIKNKNIKTILFQSDIMVGGIFGKFFELPKIGGGPSLDVTLGVKIYERLFIGFETGYHHFFARYLDRSTIYDYNGSHFSLGYVPLGANFKGYFLRNSKVLPYISCSLGGFIGVVDLNGMNGFHCQVGLGAEIRRFSFGIGYNGIKITKIDGTSVNNIEASNLGYVKFGMRF